MKNVDYDRMKKIQYFIYTMEEVPLGWRWVESRGQYVCICGYGVDVISEYTHHISGDVRGEYCENGFRATSETHYECICGERFETRLLAWHHRLDVYNDCMNEAKYKAKSYCSKCELQFKFPYDLVRHCESKRHIEADGPILKDLYCETCDIQTHTQKQMKTHLQSAKHNQIMNHGKLNLNCDVCDITCRGQKEMLAHLKTNKHKKRTQQIEKV